MAGVTSLPRSTAPSAMCCTRHCSQDGEGWLSEEDVDDLGRLSKRVVWVVDPLDGTREFVDGIPEWSISVGLVIDGTASSWRGL